MAVVGSPEGVDAALLAWVCAALPAGSPPVDSLEDLADGGALLLLARRLVPEGAAAAAAARRPLGELAEVVEILRVAQPSRAGALREDAQALLPFLLLASVEGSQREQAVGCVMGLDPSHQATLAGLLQQHMGAPGDGGSTPRRAAVSETVKRLSLQHRVSVAPRRLLADEALRAEAEDEAEEAEMRLEVQELHSELEDRRARCETARELHRQEAASLRETKERLCQEADLCHDLDKELDDRRNESRSLNHHVKLLREELSQEAGSAELDSQRASDLQRRIEEERSECRAMRKRCSEMETQLEHAYKASHERRLSWKRSALRARLTRLTEDGHSHARHLRHTRAAEATEHACEMALKAELSQAEMRLTDRDSELSSIVARVRGTEEGLQQAQSRLEICQQELRTMKMNNPEDLRAELFHRRSMERNARICSEEATARFAELEERFDSAWQLSQALQDRKAPDPGTARLSRLSLALAKSEAQVQNLRPKMGTSLSTAEAEEASAEGRRTEAGRRLEAAKEKVGRMEREAEESSRALSAMEAESLEAFALAEAQHEERVASRRGRMQLAEEMALEEAAVLEAAEAHRAGHEPASSSTAPAPPAEPVHAVAAAVPAAAPEVAAPVSVVAEAAPVAPADAVPVVAPAIEETSVVAPEAVPVVAAEVAPAAQDAAPVAPAEAALAVAAEEVAAEPALNVDGRREPASSSRARASRAEAAPAAAPVAPAEAAPAAAAEEVAAEPALDVGGGREPASSSRSRASRAEAAPVVAAGVLPALAAEAAPITPAEVASQARDAEAEKGGVDAAVLEEQIALRERELRHRESLAGEAEARHGREMRLLASALHRLGLRYGRLLSQCEALEAERSRGAQGSGSGHQ